MDHQKLFFTFMGFAIISFVVGMLASMYIEVPLMNLEKEFICPFFARKRKIASSKSEILTDQQSLKVNLLDQQTILSSDKMTMTPNEEDKLNRKKQDVWRIFI